MNTSDGAGSAGNDVRRAGSGVDRALPSRPFVGRDREMVIASGALESAVSGRGRLLLLGGEPGIGKSRTCEEIAILARSRSYEVLIGRCYEGEGAPAFWPWVQILRGFAKSRDVAALTRSVGAAASDVAQISPELRERLPDLASPAASDGEQARFRLFNGAARLFARAAEEAPLVLVLDDLQCADEPSLRLLRFLVREIADAAVLVIATYRDNVLTRDAALTETLGELAREEISERVSLKALSDADVSRYIGLLTGSEPSPALVAAVHAGTGGNPLFMTEVVRSLVENGQIAVGEMASPGPIEMPDGVRAAVARRLKLLSSDCVEMLAVAAGFGREFPENALTIACRLDRPQSHAVLEEALAARLVEPLAEVPGRYRFVHALVRDALYEETPPTRRAELHRKVGEALETVTAHDAERPLGELAVNFFAAGDVRAVEYGRLGGARALGLLAFEEAVHQYDLALRALDRAKPSDEVTRFELLLSRAEAENRAGNVDHAKLTVQRSLEIARRRGDRDQLSRAALAYGVHGVWGEPGAVDYVLVGLLEEALRAWGDEESGLQTRLLARLATALLFADALDRRRTAATRALETARRLGDPSSLAIALIAHRAVAWSPFDAEERLAMATELVKLVDESRDPERAFQAHLWRFCDLLELGDVRAVDFELGECTRIADRLRDPFHQAQVSVLGATRAALEGRFDEAEATAESLLHRGGAGPGTGNVFWLVIWMPKRWKGRLGDLAAPLGVIAEQFPGVPALEAALAVALAQEERIDDMRVHYDRLAAGGFDDIPRDQNFLVTATCLAECAALLGDPSGAQILYRALLPCARSHVVDPNGVAYFGSVVHYLGVLARTCGEHDASCDHLKESINTCTRIGARPWLALSQLELARSLAARGRAGDADEAQWHLEQAYATALTLGMTWLQKQIERFGESDSPRHAERAAAPEANPAAAAAARAAIPADPIRREAGALDVTPTWSISFDDTTTLLRDTRGVEYLGRLLDQPWEEIPASALVRDGPVSEIASGEEFSLLGEVGLSLRSNLGDAGAVIDERARREYEERLDGLRAELEEARQFHDIEWAGRVQAEIESLQNELAGAVGLRGRERRVGSDAERARIAVTKRLREVIRRIEPLNPELAHHLEGAVRTGTRCSYRPPPGPRAVATRRAGSGAGAR